MVEEERGWKWSKSETVILKPEASKELALRHNNLPHSPTERTLEDDRIKRLREILGAKRAIPFNWATVSFGGKLYRMNGQHSSKAIIDYEDGLPENLVFHLDHYEAEDKGGMANLFQQFDARWSSRSKLDVSGAFQGLNDEIAVCDRPKAKLAIEGVAWYRRTIEKVPVVGGDELYRLFFEEALYPYVRWVDEVLTVKTPEMKKASILAAMYTTFGRSESGARDFWRRVATNNDSDDSDPTSVLSADLVRDKEKETGKRGLSPGELYGICIMGWNAFRQGQKPRTLKFNTKKGLPEVCA